MKKRLWSSFWINTKKKQIISSLANSIFFSSPHYLLSASLTFTMPAPERIRHSPLRHRSHIWECPVGAPQAGAEGKQDTGTARPVLWLQSCTAHQTTGSVDHTAASRNSHGITPYNNSQAGSAFGKFKSLTCKRGSDQKPN